MIACNPLIRNRSVEAEWEPCWQNHRENQKNQKKPKKPAEERPKPSRKPKKNQKNQRLGTEWQPARPGPSRSWFPQDLVFFCFLDGVGLLPAGLFVFFGFSGFLDGFDIRSSNTSTAGCPGLGLRKCLAGQGISDI